MGQECNTYLTHVYRQPQNTERPELKHKDQELSANIVSFISCRSRLTIMLTGAASGEKGRGGGGGQVRLPDVNTRRLVGIEVQVGMLFQINGGYGRGWRLGVCE